MPYATFFDGLFPALVETREHHARSTDYHRFLASACRSAIEASDFRLERQNPIAFGPFGKIVLPYLKMGAVDSLDLFGVDELIIFSFYWTSRGRYKCALDIGANIGLHSIVMNRCGMSVRAYEPDPVHFDILGRNLLANACSAVTPVMAAVSEKDGSMEFVRVKGNTTSSHLAGSKANPYGELERFAVEVHSFARAADGATFAKIDAEGHETTILRSLPKDRWASFDAMVEVGTPENAAALYEHLRRIGVNMFVQKRGWARAGKLSDLPTNYKEGSLFLTVQRSMRW